MITYLYKLILHKFSLINLLRISSISDIDFCEFTINPYNFGYISPNKLVLYVDFSEKYLNCNYTSLVVLI